MPRSGAALAAVLLAATTIQLLGVPAHATSPEVGAALPTLLSPLTQAGVDAASSDYVLSGGGNSYDESDPLLKYTVYRTSDGSVSTTFTEPWQQESVLRPTLVRDAWLALVRPDDSHSQVDVHSAETGALVRSIDLTGKGGLLHADPLWAMVAYSTGPSTGDNGVRFVHADGSVATVPGNFFSPPTWIGGDATTAYVDSFEGQFALDVATGAKTALSFAGGAKLYAVGPTYLITAISNPDGVQGTQFTAVKRSDLSQAWSVFVARDPNTRGFYPAGNGLVEAYIADNAPSASDLSLRPISTVDGSRGADLATNTVLDTTGIRPMDDGRVALALTDTPGGRIGVLANGAITSLTTLPDVAENAQHLGVAGGKVLASWERRDGIWSVHASVAGTGTGAWSDTGIDPGFVNGDSKQIWAAGDAVLALSEYAVDGTKRWRLSWPGGHRDIQSQWVVLGHGGFYDSRYDSAADMIRVEEVKTGSVVASYPGSTFRPVRGGSLYGLINAAGTVGVTYLPTGVQSAFALPDSCPSGRVKDVRDRWLWVVCGATEKVVDRGGVYPTTVVPSGAAAYLGNGFLVEVADDGSAQPVKDYATVVDLTYGVSKVYGPVRRAGFPVLGVAVADDEPMSGGDVEAAKGFAYADATSQVHYVDVSWVGHNADEVPPAMTVFPNLQAVVADTVAHQVDLTWGWSGDPVSYDVRWRQQSGTYPAVPQWAGLSEPHKTDLIPPGTGRCYSARARDAAGNVSSWTSAVCQYVDNATPTVPVLSGFPSFPWTTYADLSVSGTSTDDDQVASYDLQRREAAPGKTYGSWKLVQSAVPDLAFDQYSVEPGAEACFRARARDRAGRVSDWSAPRCSRPAIDDPSMTRSGTATVGHTKLALWYSFTKLSGTSSKLSVPSQTGKTLGLWVLRGAGLGKGAVYVGGVKVAVVNFASSTTHSDLVLITVPGGFTGKSVVIKPTGSAPIRVDGLAVAR